MTTEQQRIKIADVCGWIVTEKGWWKHQNSDYQSYPPDYLNDLNAMREARKILNDMQKNTYARILQSLTWTSQLPQYGAIDASAADHAGAFLRTLNIWEE